MFSEADLPSTWPQTGGAGAGKTQNNVVFQIQGNTGSKTIHV